jgi:hypothetical protein
MYVCGISREELLNFLPKNAVAAEVGVYQGDFSAEILKRSQPQALHLIDPWAHQDVEVYKTNPDNSADAHEKRYQSVLKRFEAEIQNQQVRVHRKASVEAAKTFADSYFDWVYIDGLHLYEPVLEDLEAFRSKVKPTGMILGDDYANHTFVAREGYGVVEAVSEFCKRHSYEIFLLTSVGTPNFLLLPRDFVPADFRLRVMVNIASIIEIRDYSAEGISFQQSIIRNDNKICNVIPSFGVRAG